MTPCNFNGSSQRRFAEHLTRSSRTTASAADNVLVPPYSTHWNEARSQLRRQADKAEHRPTLSMSCNLTNFPEHQYILMKKCGHSLLRFSRRRPCCFPMKQNAVPYRGAARFSSSFFESDELCGKRFGRHTIPLLALRRLCSECLDSQARSPLGQAGAGAARGAQRYLPNSRYFPAFYYTIRLERIDERADGKVPRSRSLFSNRATLAPRVHSSLLTDGRLQFQMSTATPNCCREETTA